MFIRIQEAYANQSPCKNIACFFTVYIWISKQMNQPQKYFRVHLPTEKGESVRNLVVKH